VQFKIAVLVTGVQQYKALRDLLPAYLVEDYQLVLKPKPEVDIRLHGRHLERAISRHNSAVRRGILMKSDTPMQNDMPMTIGGRESKPEVESQ